MARKSKKPALKRATDRIDESLLKRSWLMTPGPKPVRATTSAVSVRLTTRARRRHAQLTAACARADPRLA